MSETYDYSSDPDMIIRYIARAICRLFIAPSINLEDSTIRSLINSCSNIDQVRENCKTFIDIATKFGWYLEHTRQHRATEIDYIMVNLRWKYNVKEGLHGILLCAFENGKVVVHTDSPLHHNVKKSCVVCRRKEKAFPKDVMSSIPGLKVVKFPSSIKGMRVFMRALNIVDYSDVVTYSVENIKIPDVPYDKYPLYINSNPMVRAYLDIEKVLSQGRK